MIKRIYTYQNRNSESNDRRDNDHKKRERKQVFSIWMKITKQAGHLLPVKHLINDLICLIIKALSHNFIFLSFHSIPPLLYVHYRRIAFILNVINIFINPLLLNERFMASSLFYLTLM